MRLRYRGWSAVSNKNVLKKGQDTERMMLKDDWIIKRKIAYFGHIVVRGNNYEILLPIGTRINRSEVLQENGIASKH